MNTPIPDEVVHREIGKEGATNGSIIEQRNGDICLLPDGKPPPSGIAGAHKVAILDATDASSWRWQPE